MSGPNAEVHFFAAQDVNGPTILTIDDTDTFFKGLSFRPALTELGGASLTMARKVGMALFDNGVLKPEVFARILVPHVSATHYQWGFFVGDILQALIRAEEAGAEYFEVSGPGPKWYLSRAIVWHENHSGTSLMRFNTDDGYARFLNDATIGDVLTRLRNQDSANPLATFVPDLTLGFNASTDSAGAAWSTPIVDEGRFELEFGTNYLEALWAIEEEGLSESTMYLGTVAAPELRLDVWQGGYTRDRLAASVDDFSAGVIHLKEGVNIASDLDAQRDRRRKPSHLLVRGLEQSFATAERPGFDPGEFARAEAIDNDTTSNVANLERRGQRYFRHLEYGENELVLELVPGVDATEGGYFAATREAGGPSSNKLWIGDEVSLTTGATGGGFTWTPLDYRNEAQRVMAIDLELREAADVSDPMRAARSWRVIPVLNVDRASASTPQGGGPGASGLSSRCGRCRRRLCEAIVSPDELHFWNAEAGSEAINWSPAGINGGSGQIEGTSCYAISTAPPGRQTSWEAEPGATYRVSGYITSDLAGQAGGPAPGGTLSIVFLSDAPGTLGGAAAGVLQTDLVATAVSGWTAFSADVTAPSGAQSAALLKGGSEGIHLDVVRIETVTGSGDGDGHADLVGTSRRVSRCDHAHHVLRDAAPTVTDDADDGYPATTLWTQVDSLVAPTSIVGTWLLIDSTPGAAVWESFGGGGVGPSSGRHALVAVLQGDGTVVPTGAKARLRVPWDCSIVRATLLAEQSGSIVVDVWRDVFANYPPTDADSITASAPLTISSDDASEDTTLTGWTTALAEGDVLIFNVDSATTIQLVTIELEVELT